MSRSKTIDCLALCLLWLMTGCASITNPVANGVPARLLPDELLVESKENIEAIPVQWLRRSKDAGSYKLDTGDILGVYIEGILPAREQSLPINFPESTSLPPSSGVPVAVRENGTVSLPFVPPIEVKGLTIVEAEEKVTKAYIEGLDDEKNEILKEGESRISVEIARPRYTRVLIIREDTPGQRSPAIDSGFRGSRNAPLAQGRGQGSGNVLEIPSLEADVLTAMTRTGGPPGPNSRNEIIIYRGFRELSGNETPTSINDLTLESDKVGSNIIRIPTRLPIGSPKPFEEADIRLEDDDIIFIPARRRDVYYTGGLLPAREVPLPSEYDVRALEAVLRIGGPVISGGRFANNLSGGITTSGLGSPNPTLLAVIRRTPKGGQVAIRVDLNRALTDPRENILIQEGDVLLLQESPAESVARYLTQTFRITGSTSIFSRGSAAAAATGSLP